MGAWARCETDESVIAIEIPALNTCPKMRLATA